MNTAVMIQLSVQHLYIHTHYYTSNTQLYHHSLNPVSLRKHTGLNDIHVINTKYPKAISFSSHVQNPSKNRTDEKTSKYYCVYLYILNYQKYTRPQMHTVTKTTEACNLVYREVIK